MAQVDAKFIARFHEFITAFFAPAITEGQSVTCYIDEDMTPYHVQGDNISDYLTGREAVMSDTLTLEQIQQMHIILPESCDTDRAIHVYLNGQLLERGNDWEVMPVEGLGSVIAWEGRGLQDLACIGDKLLVHYWERM